MSCVMTVALSRLECMSVKWTVCVTAVGGATPETKVSDLLKDVKFRDRKSVV